MHGGVGLEDTLGAAHLFIGGTQEIIHRYFYMQELFFVNTFTLWTFISKFVYLLKIICKLYVILLFSSNYCHIFFLCIFSELCYTHLSVAFFVEILIEA